VQYSIALRRAGDHLECVSISPCGFMRLEGVLAGPEAVLPLPGEPGGFVGLADGRPIDLEALRTALRQPGADVPSGVQIAPDRISDEGLDLWLALREPDVVRLMAIGRTAVRGLVPSLVATPGLASTDALVGADGCAGAALVLARGDGGDTAATRELAARPFGREGERFAHRLVEQVRAWDAHGRPGTSGLRIEVHPRAARSVPGSAIVIDKRHTRVVLGWRRPPPGPLYGCA
jgi:protein-L-isoaspartate(D-aspartate) O-methyltransferase